MQIFLFFFLCWGGGLDRKGWPQDTKPQTPFFGNIFMKKRKTQKTNGDESCFLTASGKICVCTWKPSISWLDKLYYFSNTAHPVHNFKSSKRFFFVVLEETTIRKSKMYNISQDTSAPARRLSMLIKWNITTDNRKLQNTREKENKAIRELERQCFTKQSTISETKSRHFVLLPLRSITEQ